MGCKSPVTAVGIFCSLFYECSVRCPCIWTSHSFDKLLFEFYVVGKHAYLDKHNVLSSCSPILPAASLLLKISGSKYTVCTFYLTAKPCVGKRQCEAQVMLVDSNLKAKEIQLMMQEQFLLL